MQALIKSVELKKFLNRYYFKITLTDDNGCTYVIDRPFLSNPIYFRRQVFGIMSACGSYDLMRLATDNPDLKKVIGYCMNRLNILENEKSEWFFLEEKKDKYVCEFADNNQREAGRIIINRLGKNGRMDKGVIENVISRSGTYLMFFNGEHLTTYFLCERQIYWGFGDPINIGNSNDRKNSSVYANYYQSFIVSLMKFYGINDLLHFGGKIDNLPIVEVTFDNNEIVSITNPNTGLGFSINDKYKFINIFDDKKKKMKKV